MQPGRPAASCPACLLCISGSVHPCRVQYATSATAYGRDPRFLQRSADRRRGGKIVLFSRPDVFDRFQKPRLPPLRQATAIARGHDTGRLRPFFCYVRFRTASFNVPVPICFSFLRTAPAVSVSRPAHSVLSRLPPKAYVFPRGFRSYRGAIPGAV